MKIKTSEATGAVLDYLVAKCEYDELSMKAIQYPAYVGTLPIPRPSTDWAQGGPIIEREGISPAYNPSVIYESDARWKAFGSFTDGGHQYGPTPLIAAMRCYVASKLGNEVEVPDGLV